MFRRVSLTAASDTAYTPKRGEGLLSSISGRTTSASSIWFPRATQTPTSIFPIRWNHTHVVSKREGVNVRQCVRDCREDRVEGNRLKLAPHALLLLYLCSVSAFDNHQKHKADKQKAADSDNKMK